MTALEKLEHLLRTRDATAEIYIDSGDKLCVIEISERGTNIAYERGETLEFAIVCALDTLGEL